MREYTCPTCEKALTTMQAVRNHPCDPERVEESDAADATEGNTNTRRLGGLLGEGVKEFMMGASRGMVRNNERGTRSPRKDSVEGDQVFPEETTEETSRETQETRKHELMGGSTPKTGMSPSRTGTSRGSPAETSQETPGTDFSGLTQRERTAFDVLERCEGTITDAELAERVGYANRSGAWKVRQKWEERRS